MITSLRLETFKNFRDATLTLGPLTVIVGTNASGKSNLRDAFRFLHGMARGYSVAEIIGEKYGEGGVLQWRGIRGGTKETPTFGCRDFSLSTALIDHKPDEAPTGATKADEWSGKHDITIRCGNRQSSPVVVRERLDSNWEDSPVFDTHPNNVSPFLFGDHTLLVQIVPRTSATPRGNSTSFLSSRPILTQAVESRVVPVARKMQIERVVDELLSMRFLDLSPEAMKAPSFPGQTVLGDRGENLSSVLQAICENPSTKSALVEWIRQLTPLDVVDLDFIPDQVGRILVFLVEANGQRTSAYSASDGTLRFLAMIAALLGPDPARFYFLEELDNGIHPTRLYLLLQLIEQRAREHKVQVVTTTHSPQLLAMLSPEAREHASLVYRLEGSTEAKIVRIMDIPEARRVLEEQNLARLHESGWLEDAVSFQATQEAEA